MTNTQAATNPVVRSEDYRGWAIREYADGTFDAAELDGPGLSPGFIGPNAYWDAIEHACLEGNCSYTPVK